MKVIGLVGGISWQSTQAYYHHINSLVQLRMGGSHSADMRIHSLNFFEVEKCIQRDDFPSLIRLVSGAAKGLEQAGADVILIGANTMHVIYPQVANDVHVPVLHIADATLVELKLRKITHISILGTAFTMENQFLKDKYTSEGIGVMVPEKNERDWLQHLIFNELFLGILNENSRQHLLNIIVVQHKLGAQAVVLACTELPLLVQQKDSYVPILDTTFLHAKLAVDFALKTT